MELMIFLPYLGVIFLPRISLLVLRIGVQCNPLHNNRPTVEVADLRAPLSIKITSREQLEFIPTIVIANRRKSNENLL